MPKAVISDASCLIILSKIDGLSLLRSVFGVVQTTPEIAQEARFELPDWIEIISPTNTSPMEAMPSSIDLGEATAIALALETPESTLVLDDLTARNYAARLGIAVTGTVGILVSAKIDGHISSIKPFIESIGQTNFRLGSQVISDAYRLAGESDQ